MEKQAYEELLAKAPQHSSPSFITFLRENNKVMKETDYYIIIENIKYSTPERPFYTIFSKNHPDSEYAIISYLTVKFPKHEWLKKDESRQTVKRFHIHFYRNIKNEK